MTAAHTSGQVDELLAEMTLDEKLAQLGSVWVFDLLDGHAFDHSAAAGLIAHGIGHVSRVAGATSMATAEVRDWSNDMQRYLVEQTRLGIPAIVHEECKSGYMAAGAPAFGAPLGLASSFDAALIEEIATAIGEDMRAAGAHQGLGPDLDIGLDPRWGRLEETFGEDPTLVSHLGSAFVRGLQGRGPTHQVLATVKHFVAHGSPMGGRNANPVSVGSRELIDIDLRPFEHAIRGAGAASVMHAYHELDGIPVLASPGLLTDVLRDQLGFEGYVVGDYNGIEELVHMHRYAPTMPDAAAMALRAGLDLEVPSTVGFGDPLRTALDQGLVDMADVDLAVRRVLLAKASLGLFDSPYAAIEAPTGSRSGLLRRAALGSLVLVENRDRRLPLDDGLNVALIGPGSDDPRILFGDYAHVAHMELLADHKEMVGDENSLNHLIPADLVLDTDLSSIPTIRNVFDDRRGGDVAWARGCGLVDGTDDEIADAAQVAAESDVAVVVLAERSGLSPENTCGEARDRVSLDPIGRQGDLLDAVIATGTPVVLVVISGRPWTLERYADHVEAILLTPPPGASGAEAIVDVLTGRAEPQGRLAVSVPRHVGQLPVHHWRVAGALQSRWHGDYVDCPADARWVFGHGLGYAPTEVGPLTLSAETCDVRGTVTATTTVTNTGDRETRAVVQLYASVTGRSLSRPAQEFVAALPVDLAPGATSEVVFAFAPSHVAHPNRAGDVVAEPGPIQLSVGLASDSVSSTAVLEVTGETAAVHRTLCAAHAR